MIITNYIKIEMLAPAYPIIISTGEMWFRPIKFINKKTGTVIAINNCIHRDDGPAIIDHRLKRELYYYADELKFNFHSWLKEAEKHEVVDDETRALWLLKYA